VSTVGLVGGIERLARENLRVNLAISLHATTNETRDRLMPVNKGFAIEPLLAACRRFPLPFRQRMTFEYVLLDASTTRVRTPSSSGACLKGIRAKVNLIPFNDLAGSPLRPAPAPPHPGLPERAAGAGDHRPPCAGARARTIGAACASFNEAVVA